MDEPDFLFLLFVFVVAVSGRRTTNNSTARSSSGGVGTYEPISSTINFSKLFLFNRTHDFISIFHLIVFFIIG